MNKDRRKALAEITNRIEELRATVESLVEDLTEIRDEEQDYYDNMPESIQYGEKGDTAQAAIDALDEGISSLEEFDFDSIVSSIEEATG